MWSLNCVRCLSSPFFLFFADEVIIAYGYEDIEDQPSPLIVRQERPAKRKRLLADALQVDARMRDQATGHAQGLAATMNGDKEARKRRPRSK